MADDAKNNNFITTDQLKDFFTSRDSRNRLQSSLDDDEFLIDQQHQARIQSLNEREKKLDYLEKKYNHMIDNLAKAVEKGTEVTKRFSNEINKTSDALNKAGKSSAMVRDEISNAEKAYEKAMENYRQDKQEIATSMSDIVKGVEDDIVKTRQNMIQLGRLFEQDREQYAEQFDASIKAHQQALKQREETEKLQWKYMTANERQNAVERARQNYKEQKRELDMRFESGHLSVENYDILLKELSKTFAGKSDAAVIGSKMLGGLTEGKPIGQIINTGVQDALSLSPIGQAVLTISSYVGKIFSVLNSGVQASSNMAKDYLGKIDARLQGSSIMDSGEKGYGIYKKINRDLVQQFVASPYVNQKELMQSISQFVDAGVTWNVEQRALIETLSDKMVTTFEALDASLTRLIRIQGADLTMPAMGAEAQLTKFLNKNFEDTSYLKALYDNVSAAVLDASSQLNYEGAIGFNYAVQKWLGSLYSVGMSESGVSTIAQGLNYLATGNADALSGNASLQNLFALSATNAGLNYADLLKTGLNADNTDILLESMVKYLQGIYSNINNNVVKSAWSNIAGLSVTDLRAISNLSQTEISNIASSDMTYATAMNEFQTQLYKIEERTSPAEVAANLMDNILLNIGNTMLGMNDANTFGSSGLGSYLTWQLGEKLGGIGGTLLQGLTIASNLFSGARTTGDWSSGDRVRDYQITSEETGDYSLIDLLTQSIDMATHGALNLTNGFEYIWNPNDFESGFFGSAHQLTLKDRALNYIPLLGALASTNTGNLTSTGTDLSSILQGAAAVSGLAQSVFSEGTSFAVTNATSASSKNYSLSNNDLVTAQVSTVTGSENELATKTVYDLYTKLFEQRDMPIRVQLAEFEELATKSLKESLIADMASDVRYLANQASGSGINVDLGAEDAALMRNQIYTVREM